jgi:hypothetical protein
MGWRIGIAAVLLAWSAGVAARHSSAVLDPRKATPGIRIELVELPRLAPSYTARYRLRAEGVPQGVGFGVWTKNFAGSFQEALPGFTLDQSGALVSVDKSGKTLRLDEKVLEPGPYLKGAAWTVALASDDHKLSAFARVIPYPIGARDGNCAVSLELVSVHGDRFITTGTGFAPGEDVDIELRYSGRVTRKKQRVTGDGRLDADLLSLGAANPDPTARLAVKATSCQLAVEYEWGEPALKRR